LRLLDEELSETYSFRKQITASFPLLAPAGGLIIGIVLQRFLHFPVFVPFVTLAVVLTASAVLMRICAGSRRLAILIIAVFVGFICLGSVRLMSFSKPRPDDIRHLVAGERVLATITGVVKTKPRQDSTDGWAFGRYYPMPPGGSFYLRAEKIKTRSGWADVSGTVRVQVSGGITDTSPGDRVKIYCWLSRFGPSLNPGQFDVAKYLANRGVFIAASAGSGQAIELLEKAPSTSFARVRNALATIAAEALFADAVLDGQEGALLSALLLGERTDIDAATYHAFRQTGLLHFISLSGMHLGILAWFIWRLSKIAGLGKRKRAIVLMVLIALYILAIPPRAPTLRAACICWVFCASVIVRRRANALNTLSLAAIVLLLFRPLDLFGAGWQLSYGAVLGIILMQRRIAGWLRQRTIDRIKLFQPDDQRPPLANMLADVAAWATELLAAGLSAWLGGAGVMLWHFGSITPLASLWTVLVFPLILVILMGGFVTIALAGLLPTASLLSGHLIAAFSALLIWVVGLLAKLNISGVLIGKTGITVIIAYYLLLFFARFGQLKPAGLKRRVCTVLAILIVASLGVDKYKRSRPDHLSVTCLAVGHGQAIVTSLPQGKNLLFDAGSISSRDCGGRIVVPFLLENGISTLDAVYLSHDDMDHINGLPEILVQCKTDRVCVNQAFIQDAASPSMAGFLKSQLKLMDMRLETVHDDTASEAKVRLLWPDEETLASETASDNDKSQVVLIEFAGRKIMLCSDIERYAQERIIAKCADLPVDVVVMPHHGSLTNSVDGFAEKLGAKTVIISCSRLRQRSAYKPPETIQAFYTPIDGAITVKVSSKGQLDIAATIKQDLNRH
jgi:DNA internalization-related competence protein ComEC/Rec2